MIPILMEDVIKSIKVPDIDFPGSFISINYQPGLTKTILDSLSTLDSSSTQYKSLKYPLIAIVLPIKESRGTSTYYAKIRIKRIVFAVLTSAFDGTDLVLSKYRSNGVFKKVLYPLYYGFLEALANNNIIVGMEPNSFIHTKMDNPCQQPIGQGLSDYVDTIEILDLELILNQLKLC